jgi:hypothetical protein
MDRYEVLEPGGKIKPDKKLVKLQAKETESLKKAARQAPRSETPTIAPPADDLFDDSIESPLEPQE